MRNSSFGLVPVVTSSVLKSKSHNLQKRGTFSICWRNRNLRETHSDGFRSDRNNTKLRVTETGREMEIILFFPFDNEPKRYCKYFKLNCLLSNELFVFLFFFQEN